MPPYIEAWKTHGVWDPALPASQEADSHWWRKYARPELWASSVSSPVSQCMLLLPGISSFPQPQPPPPFSPHRPIKGWFSTPAGQPRRLAARDRWEAGKGQWASIWALEGCWAQASNWTENSPALTYRPRGAGFNHTHTVGEFNLHQQTCTTRPLYFNGVYSLPLWHPWINKRLKNVDATHFINQFNNILFRHQQWT